MIRSFLALLLLLYVFSYSVLGQWLEISMPRHILIQLPVLVIIGYLFAYKYLKHQRILSLLNEKGIPGMLLCILIGGYWMLPRLLDMALSDPVIALAKYISLPFFVGMPLAISWQKIHPIAKAVIKIEFVTMLFRLGWLYLVSPNRLCHTYQLSEQIVLGQYFILLAILFSVYWIVQLFSGDYREEGKKVQGHILFRLG